MHAADSLGADGFRPDDPRWLHPALIDAVARRVLELVREPPGHRSGPSGLLTVAEVAERLRVSTKWVYAHQHRLGAMKLGDGPKARLRFDATTVAAELEPSDSEVHGLHGTSAPEPPAKVKRTRRRLVSRPLPAIDRAQRRA